MIVTLLIIAGLLITSLIYFFVGAFEAATPLIGYALVTGVIYLIIRYRNK